MSAQGVVLGKVYFDPGDGGGEMREDDGENLRVGRSWIGERTCKERKKETRRTFRLIPCAVFLTSGSAAAVWTMASNSSLDKKTLEPNRVDHEADVAIHEMT